MTAEAHPFEIRTEGLVLRPWVASDADAVEAAVADPAIARWWPASLRTRDDVAAWIARRADWSAGDHVSLAIDDLFTGEFVGSVSLFKIDRDQGDAEIGYWTAPAGRGRGVAPAAVRALCRWAFEQLPIERIVLYHAVENPASGRVAAKAGFTQEGRLRQSFRNGDGRRHDELLWGLLRGDLR